MLKFAAIWPNTWKYNHGRQITSAKKQACIQVAAGSLRQRGTSGAPTSLDVAPDLCTRRHAASWLRALTLSIPTQERAWGLEEALLLDVEHFQNSEMVKMGRQPRMRKASLGLLPSARITAVLSHLECFSMLCLMLWIEFEGSGRRVYQSPFPILPIFTE